PREKRTRPANLTVTLHPNFPDQEVVVGGSLSDRGRTELCSLLKKNLDILAWKPSDMTGVPRKKTSKIFSAKRLRRYFQVHPITVITDQPIKQVMSRPDVGGRLQKWSIMLGEHNITYRPRTSIKGQILADFLNEMPGNASQNVSVATTQEKPWTLFTDGSSCVDGSGAGLILTNLERVEFNYALRFQFAASNNEAEYEALIVAKGLVSGFKTFSIIQVPHSRNKKADALSKIVSTSFAHLSKQVLVEVLETKSITGKEVTAVIEEEGPTWMTELVNYLKEGILPGDEKEARKLRLKARILPGDEKEARKLRLKARQYRLMEGVFYKRSFLTPWLRCVGPLQAEYVMREIHEGSCSMHAGPRRKNKNWVEKLPHVLWAHRTMIKSIHGDTPFSLTYGTEVVMHAKIGMPTYRTTAVDMVNNDEELRLNLDLLEERRELAAMNEAKSNSKMMKYYNSRVRGVAFKPRDFVYRINDATHAVAGGKLGPKWEGPYEVTDAVRGVAFKPRDFVYRSNDASHAVAGGKLGPKWEGPYEVTDALGNEAYNYRWDSASKNVECHKSQAMLPLSIGTDSSHG
nr:reverse transcriptase domain-containing protein [Tanacetum cinerariifolium]